MVEGHSSPIHTMLKFYTIIFYQHVMPNKLQKQKNNNHKKEFNSTSLFSVHGIPSYIVCFMRSITCIF
jgi:hypothetical protein